MEEIQTVNLSSIPSAFHDWDVGHEYEVVKQLGSGAYGYVVEAIQKSTKKKVAIKKIKELFDDIIDAKRILREITLLRKINHPNIVKIIDILEPKDLKNFQTLYIIMDFCTSDLKKLFKSPIYLQPLHLQTLIYNILCGLKYLHSANVLHRDMKPANILINEDCSVKICDFGLARSMEGIIDSVNEQSIKKADVTKGEIPDEENPVNKKMNIINRKRQLTSHVVTRWYRAPELILLERNYDASIDMWSLGCIAAELQCMLKENAACFVDRTPLFPGNSCFPLSPEKVSAVKKSGYPRSNTDQMNVIFSVLGTPGADDVAFVTDPKALQYLKTFPESKKVEIKSLYKGSNEEAIDFISKLVVFNPKKRMTVDQALNHPYLNKVRDKKKEKLAESAIDLDFEKEGELSEERLRELFTTEIQLYHKKK